RRRGVQREQDFGSPAGLATLEDRLLAHEPTPLEAAALADELEQVMRRLVPRERRILELRLQGYTIDEVAAQVGCGERTVRYLLKEITQQLEHWGQEKKA